MTKKQVAMICLINRLSSVIREEYYTKGIFTMKKNTMMRVATVLMVAVLLTTCAISGTFAKYVTSDSAEDSARVAKWGVAITATGEDAFAIQYKDTAGDNGTKVVSTVNVVAPGTNGNLGGVTITGTPEVEVELVRNATLDLTGWEVDGAYYCPLVITVNSTEFDGTTYSSADDFEDAVLAAINKTTTYAAGTNLATNDNLDITWEWAFNGDDVKDTALGNAAVGGDIKIEFSLEVTVTQVD